MRKGTPNQFIHELINKIDELKSEDVESSAVIVDEDDVIEADEIIDEVSEPETTDETYLEGLYSSVEDKLNDLVSGVSWSGDEENIYMDVNFLDGSIFTFTIPRNDLVFDMDNMNTDVNYICTAVRDLKDEDENSIDETFDDVDSPAYL